MASNAGTRFHIMTSPCSYLPSKRPRQPATIEGPWAAWRTRGLPPEVHSDRIARSSPCGHQERAQKRNNNTQMNMIKANYALVWDWYYLGLTSIRGALIHWGRVTHICISKLTIIGSDNGLSPERRQANIWTNAGILFIGTLGTNLSDVKF